VWTGDGKHFFFNPSARLSLWDIPEDLRHRPDLQKLIDDGPAQPEDQEKPISKPNPILDDPIIEESEKQSEEKADEEPAAKKPKVTTPDPEAARKKREQRAEQLRFRK